MKLLVQICCWAGEVQRTPPWGAGQERGSRCLIFDASHGFEVSPHSFCWCLRNAAMSASTRTTSTVHKPRQFPGNCTMEMALKTIVDVFHRYSSRKNNIDLLDSKNFQKLMKEQAPTFLEDCVSATGASLERCFSWGGCGRDEAEVSFRGAPGVMGCSPHRGCGPQRGFLCLNPACPCAVRPLVLILPATAGVRSSQWRLGQEPAQLAF